MHFDGSTSDTVICFSPFNRSFLRFFCGTLADTFLVFVLAYSAIGVLALEGGPGECID